MSVEFWLDYCAFFANGGLRNLWEFSFSWILLLYVRVFALFFYLKGPV